MSTLGIDLHVYTVHSNVTVIQYCSYILLLFVFIFSDFHTIHLICLGKTDDTPVNLKKIHSFLHFCCVSLQILVFTFIVLLTSWSSVTKSMMLPWQHWGLLPEWRETGFTTGGDHQGCVVQVRGLSALTACYSGCQIISSLRKRARDR